MAGKSYINLLSLIESFADAHLQVRRFGSDFHEQIDGFATREDSFPVLYVTLSDSVIGENTTQHTLVIYCFDLLQQGRENVNYLVSDTELIMKDLFLWIRDSDDTDSVEVIGDATTLPMNNYLLDDAVGHSMTVTLALDSFTHCDIPMTPIPPPSPVVCEDAEYAVINSEDTVVASGTIPSGGVKDDILAPDATVQLNGSTVGTIAAGATDSFPVTQGGSPVGSWNGTAWIIPECDRDVFLKGLFAATEDEMRVITIDADNAGTFTTLTTDGGSGAITFEINGAPATLPFTTVVGNNFQMFRATNTNDGWAKISGTF